MTLPFILIPIKSLAEGKSRLACVLGPRDRRALNEELLRRSLNVAIGYGGTSNCAVVSHCAEALEFARARGVRTIRHSGIGGLNAAVEWGLGELRFQGAGDVLVMSCDMPRLRVSDLRQMAEIGVDSGCVVIGADRHGSGTNLVLVPAGLRLRFSYGVQSLQRHVDEAVRVAGGSRIYRSEGVGFDIDTPDDLQGWQYEQALVPTPQSKSPCLSRAQR